MSGADVPSDIEREFKEAKRVARAYLRSAGLLPPEGTSQQEHETEQRWREERNMRDTILRGSSLYGLPNDPDAYNAADLGRRYLHCGRDDEVLDALLERERTHWTYRMALDWVVCGLLATGADVDRVPARGVRASRSTRLPAGRAGPFRLPRRAA